MPPILAEFERFQLQFFYFVYVKGRTVKATLELLQDILRQEHEASVDAILHKKPAPTIRQVSKFSQWSEL